MVSSDDHGSAYGSTMVVKYYQGITSTGLPVDSYLVPTLK